MEHHTGAITILFLSTIADSSSCSQLAMNVNRTTPRSKLNTTTSRGGGGGGINGFVSNRSSRRWLSHVFVAVCSFLLGAVYDYDYEFSTPNDVVAGAGTARTSAPAPAPSLLSFRDVATQTQTDKVAGYGRLPPCLEKKGTACLYPYAERETCRVWGHFYDTIYDRWYVEFLLCHKTVSADNSF